VIGPGWMPSRPRPLARVRRSVLSYSFRPRRRRGPPRSARGASVARDGGTADCDTRVMLFDGAPAELPTAMLLPGSCHARHRLIGGHLRHWLDDRWAWLRPRTVPMIAAFVGMLAVLGSTRYLSTFAMSSAPRNAGIYDDRAAPHAGARSHAGAPGRIHVVPVRPGDHNVAITLEP